jgi:hypothetical protein
MRLRLAQAAPESEVAVRLCGMEKAMNAAQFMFLGAAGQLFGAQGADRLQHPIADAVAMPRNRDQRFARQRIDDVAYVECIEIAAGADRFRRLERETTGKRRRAQQRLPVPVGEQIIGPLHRMEQRPVAFAERARPAGEKAQTLAEPVEDLAGRERSAAGDRKLDRQRNAVERAADLSDLSVDDFRTEPRRDGLRPFDEELHRRGRGARRFQRRERPDMLAADGQRLAAGHDDLDRRAGLLRCSPSFGQISGRFKLLPAPAGRFRWC